MEINLVVLNEILSLRKISHLKNLMSGKVKNPFFTQKEIISMKKRDIINLAQSLNERQVALPCKGESMRERWMWGEQKLFIWIILYYAAPSLLDANAMVNITSYRLTSNFKKLSISSPTNNPPSYAMSSEWPSIATRTPTPLGPLKKSTSFTKCMKRRQRVKNDGRKSATRFTKSQEELSSSLRKVVVIDGKTTVIHHWKKLGGWKRKTWGCLRA